MLLTDWKNAANEGYENLLFYPTTQLTRYQLTTMEVGGATSLIEVTGTSFATTGMLFTPFCDNCANPVGNPLVGTPLTIGQARVNVLIGGEHVSSFKTRLGRRPRNLAVSWNATQGLNIVPGRHWPGCDFPPAAPPPPPPATPPMFVEASATTATYSFPFSTCTPLSQMTLAECQALAVAEGSTFTSTTDVDLPPHCSRLVVGINAGVFFSPVGVVDCDLLGASGEPAFVCLCKSTYAISLQGA